MAAIDLHGFIADIKSHVSEHGFHIFEDRHVVETYSNRQIWEVDLHPEHACGGPLNMIMALEADARTLIAFEDALARSEHDLDIDENIVVPLSFGFMLPPLIDGPDLLVLTTELAALGGVHLPLQVSVLEAYDVVSDRPERTISITGRVDLPLVHIYNGEDNVCELLGRTFDICEFLLDRAPAWLDDPL